MVGNVCCRAFPSPQAFFCIVAAPDTEKCSVNLSMREYRPHQTNPWMFICEKGPTNVLFVCKNWSETCLSNHSKDGVASS